MKLRGVKFDNVHTGDDWKMTLHEMKISPPEPKTIYVAVDGRDGDLDLTESLTGEVKYKDRPASFVFILTEGSHLDREKLIDDVLQTIHGRQLSIILPDDPDHYLLGRCKVEDYANNIAYGTIAVSAMCQPWRYAVLEAVRTMTVTGTEKELNCTNLGRKTVVPTFTVTGSVTVGFGAVSVALSDGVYTVPEIRFPAGVNILQIGGTGTVQVSYREGVL